MRVLAGRVERVLVHAAVVVADRRPRLYRIGNQPLVHKFQRRDMMRLGKGLVDRRLVVLDEPPVEAEVGREGFVHLDGTLGQRVAHIDHGGQLVDVADDGFHRIARLIGGLGDHPGDGLAHMPHDPFGKDRMARLLLRAAVAAGHAPGGDEAALGLEVVAGENGNHPRHGCRLGRVEAADAPVGDTGAQELHMGLTRTIHIVDVPAAPGEKAEILAALEGRAYPVILRHGPGPLLCGDAGDTLARCGQDRLDDVVIPRAAADVAFKVMAYLHLGRFRIVLQQRRRRHHHARRAEAALQPVVILERLLDPAKLTRRRSPSPRWS